ncbi:hypothetical protein DFH08DRAFT_901765 [Mycena albidolilacea]|uniref:Uncharacterized protein n=1 Tax=Mycena albidolilacea TaxID=1033008 RepID=A0AAD6Z4I3_9AGAR|nr:hypothetical protein DFH08DRAFT_901765 [Mycena albidolilacea]
MVSIPVLLLHSHIFLKVSMAQHSQNERRQLEELVKSLNTLAPSLIPTTTPCREQLERDSVGSTQTPLRDNILSTTDGFRTPNPVGNPSPRLPHTLHQRTALAVGPSPVRSGARPLPQARRVAEAKGLPVINIDPTALERWFHTGVCENSGEDRN